MTEVLSMRTVLLTAAGTLCLVFAAHAADAPRANAARNEAARADLSQALPAAPAPVNSCIDTGASLSHAAYTTDDDAECCTGSPYCSQYLSTQMLVQAPSQGHT